MSQSNSEEWRPVPGWPSLYEVSSHGRVRSLPRRVTYQRNGREVSEVRGGVLLSLKPDSKGYVRVTMRDGKRKQRMGVHRMVLAAFKSEPPSPRAHCRHLDGNPSHNWLTNLAWGSAKDNAADRAAHGRSKGAPKLTAREVLAMRRLYACGVRCSAMASAFGVHDDTVRRAVSGESWPHLPEAQEMGQPAHRARRVVTIDDAAGAGHCRGCGNREHHAAWCTQ